MELLKELLHRIAGLFHKTELEQRLAEETAFHLDMLTEKYRRQGLSAKDAHLAAKREFGGLSPMHEQFREQSSFAWAETLRIDLRYAFRSFRRTPAVTALIVLMLGLGIGANTAIFSFLSELILRPLPYTDPATVVVVQREQYDATSPREFAAVRSARSFTSVATMFLYRGVNLETATTPRHVTAIRITEGYFRTIGIQPFLGRTFLPEEDTPNGPNAAILNYQLWQEAFQSDPNVLGRKVRINGTPHTIIAVMPAAFSARERAKLWLPLQSSLRGNDTNYTMLARLAPGVTPQQAAAEVDSFFNSIDQDRIAQLKPGDKFNRRPAVVIPAQQVFSAEFRKEVLLLFAAVGVMLFVACLNAANLLLARSAARSREIAIRCALGAGRSRIVRQLLTESVLLSTLSGLAGLAIGKLFVIALTTIAPYEPLRHIDLDPKTLAFTLAISLLTGLFFGLAPALQSIRPTTGEALKESATRTSATRSALRGRQLLVIGQVALCTVLLSSAGLLVRTFLNLRAISPGFDSHQLWTAPMVFNADKLESIQTFTTYIDQARRRMLAIPGVLDAGVTNQLPSQGQFNLPVELIDAADTRTRSLQFRMQTTNTFRLLGMPVLRGRDFIDSDRAGAPPSAIVNEAFVRRFFPNDNALGKRISMTLMKVPDVFTIVGIVADVREMGPKSPIPPTVYITTEQIPIDVLKGIFQFVSAKWIVRITTTAANVIPQLQNAAGSLDAAQPFQEFQSMDAIVAATAKLEKFLMTLLTAFAALTLLMVAGGIYGTLAYTVSQRRQEIGIRMALGARATQIATLILTASSRQILTGLALGLTASYWVTSLLTGFLFGLKPLDPTTLAASAALLLLIGTIASTGPSLTAARLDPVKTLRTD